MRGPFTRTRSLRSLPASCTRGHVESWTCGSRIDRVKGFQRVATLHTCTQPHRVKDLALRYAAARGAGGAAERETGWATDAATDAMARALQLGITRHVHALACTNHGECLGVPAPGCGSSRQLRCPPVCHHRHDPHAHPHVPLSGHRRGDPPRRSGKFGSPCSR